MKSRLVVVLLLVVIACNRNVKVENSSVPSMDSISNDSIFRVHRADTIKKIVENMSEVRGLDSLLRTKSNGKRKIYVWVLPQKKIGNVRVGEMHSDSSIYVWDNYTVDPYTLHVGKIEY